MKRQIVFVLSTNYAGSHFLSLQLASHSRCVSLGEFHRYKRAASRRRQACSICETDEDCPLFHGLEGVPLNQLYERIFENIAAMDPNINTGIDNSKKPQWARRFLNLEGFRLKFVHLIRDPRALVRRWTLCYDTPAAKTKVRQLMARRCWRHFLGIMRGSEASVYVHKWAYQNQRISDFIARHDLDATQLTYHDLTLCPEQVLGNLMPWLELDFEPSQLEYWTVTHHGSQKPHYMKPPPGGKTFYDLRWQEFLDHEAKMEIEAHPAVQRYLAQQDITMQADGLTMHPDWQVAAKPGDGGEGATS